MKTISIFLINLLIIALLCGPASAWSRAGRGGGSWSHTEGSTSHSSRWGTSTSHIAGEGTSHTNIYGGSTSHGYGEGTIHTNMYGGSATHYAGGGWSKTGAYGGTAYGDAHYGGAYYPPRAAYYPYHPPTTVNVYGSGCYNCGGWSTAGAAAAGAAVGMVAGATITSANTAASAANAYNAGVAAGSASTTAAYAAGAASGAPTTSTTTTATTVDTTYVMGAIYAKVPAGSMVINKNGTTYYLSGNTWFQPSYGANGVYYRVVTAP